MMNREIIVKRSRVLGFCMGVRRAMRIVEDLMASEKSGPVCTIGPLIHNQQVLAELESKGVHRIDDPLDAVSGTVVIRAHGLPPSERGVLEGRGLKIIDATCPRVITSQRTVAEYSEKGYQVVIIGDRDHGEVKGLAGFASACAVVQSRAEAERFSFSGKTVVIAQTTLRPEDYADICSIIKVKDPDVEIVMSICSATRERQESLFELLKDVDALVVVGGKNSANTVRLFEIAKNSGKPSWHIEVPEELPEEIWNYRSIGLTAGASTPDWLIDAVEARIKG
jgi:4-hydroxy-3-methylbut-2-enyl diphosphate reductase